MIKGMIYDILSIGLAILTSVYKRSKFKLACPEPFKKDLDQHHLIEIYCEPYIKLKIKK